MKQGRRQKTRTIELYKIAENSGTQILCCDLPHTRSVSAMSCTGTCYIGMDPFEIETSAEERVHLAHELGHCETGSFYNAYSSLEIRAKKEIKADRWAFSRLIPVWELNSVLENGIVELWDLAEYFGVTEDFMLKAVDYYRAEGFINYK